jgi:excisionase family DNA binding protein
VIEVDKMLTAKEVCEWLGISRVTLKSWCDNKGMPFYKAGKLLRFDPDEIKEWMRNKNEDKN